MHNFLFAARRVYHQSNRLAAGMLAQFELTAARFDMLYAIRQYGDGKIWQSELRKILGVKAPAAKRMVDALAKLGFVERKRVTRGDRRQCVVRLTKRGRRRILVAKQAALDDAIAHLAVEAMTSRSPLERKHATADLEVMMAAMRRAKRALGGCGTFAYPARLKRPRDLGWRMMLQREYAYNSGRLNRTPGADEV